jgi:hypothetical protein
MYACKNGGEFIHQAVLEVTLVSYSRILGGICGCLQEEATLVGVGRYTTVPEGEKLTI